MTTGVRKTVLTSEMTAVELARVWAEHMGYGIRVGSNWIYSPSDRPICSGWVEFAALLEAAGYIAPGKGVDWQHTSFRPPSGRLRP